MTIRGYSISTKRTKKKQKMIINVYKNTQYDHKRTQYQHKITSKRTRTTTGRHNINSKIPQNDPKETQMRKMCHTQHKTTTNSHINDTKWLGRNSKDNNEPPNRHERKSCVTTTTYGTMRHKTRRRRSDYKERDRRSVCCHCVSFFCLCRWSVWMTTVLLSRNPSVCDEQSV